MSSIEFEVSPQITRVNGEQIRRARRLLAEAAACQDGDLQFILLVGALHLSRSIVEHWLTIVGEKLPHESGLDGAELDQLKRNLRADVTSIFESTQRYEVISELRNWDYHWEPLVNPRTIPSNAIY